jgi:hypothetical protein
MNTKRLNSEVEVISMVVPSVNGNKSNLIILSDEHYNRLRDMADDKTKPKNQFFALFCDANAHHDILNTRFGAITKEQFDIVIKEDYNLSIELAFTPKSLKKIK